MKDGAGGGIRTHEGLHHRNLSPAPLIGTSILRSLDHARVPPRWRVNHLVLPLLFKLSLYNWRQIVR